MQASVSCSLRSPQGGLRNAALLREIADSEPSVRPYHQAAAMLKHILCKAEMGLLMAFALLDVL